MKKKQHNSALNVNKGVEQPPSINPNFKHTQGFKRRPERSAEEYFHGIRQGDRSLLSQAITLIESQRSQHQELAQDIIARCLPYSGNSIRIGITGVPGVGKSSFIEAIGNSITDFDRSLAVLAIDPSSERSKGSILGDKTRMESLANNPKAFIRPSPSAGTLGGVARKTREIMVVCEAAGFNTIFVETVGVGQSEIAVHSMVDVFLLLMLAGAGDELQGIKRGIMEMADILAITKSDGDNTRASQLARIEYSNALHLFPPAPSGWEPEVLCISSKEQTGLDKLWKRIEAHLNLTKAYHYFDKRREDQLKAWMNETIRDQLGNHFYHHPTIVEKLGEIEQAILSGKLSPYVGAQQLLTAYFNHPVG